MAQHHTAMGQGLSQAMHASASMQLQMRVLAANATELEQLLSEAIASNPVLDIPTKMYHHPSSSEAYDYIIESLEQSESLGSHLAAQIRQSGLKPDVEAAALYLISNLDEHAYFEEDPYDLAAHVGYDIRTTASALKAIEDLEPAGVGARNLQHSLLLQLERLDESKGIAYELIAHHWDKLAKHQYAQAAQAMDVEEEAILGAARRISQLNPKPAGNFSNREERPITPDILVIQEGEELNVQLNEENIPQLSLNADYRQMMAEKADNEQVRQYLSQRFREGRDLMRALELRQHSLLLIARALVVRQRAFFKGGELKALKMEQLAQDTELHISTISRALRHKHLQCPRGIFALKDFLSTALSPTAEGQDISSAAAKARIHELIAHEDKKRPLSDAKLEAQLATQGIHIARRTIAKYREELKILPASLRKGSVTLHP